MANTQEKVRQRLARLLKKRSKAADATTSHGSATESVSMRGKPTLNYLRAIAWPALLFSVAAVLIQEYFWLAIILIYAAFIVLFVDACFDKSLPGFARITLALVLVVGCSAFSKEIVWPRATFIPGVIVIAPHADSSGALLYGIQWKPEYSELRLFVSNDSAGDYTDISLSVETDLYIAKIAQITKHTIEMDSDVSSSVVTLGQGADARSVPADAETPSHKWTIKCDRLRKGEMLGLLLAARGRNPSTEEASPNRVWR